MYNLIRVELFKLRKDKAFRMLMLLISALAIIFPLFSYFDNKTHGFPLVPGIAFLFDSIGINSFFIKFGTAILAGFFIANEYSTGVMKTIVSSGNSRGRLFMAKLIGFAAGAMAISVAFPVISTIEATLLAGFGQPAVDATSVFGQLPPGVPVAFILRAFGLTLLFSASFAVISALFSTLLTESGKTIGLTIIFFMMIDTILSMLGSYFPVFETIYDYSVFKLIGQIGEPVLEVGTVQILLVPLLTIAVAGLLGAIVFRRKEIK
ncbi:ABC transporter permease [Cohnella lupini]|uniref:ABC-2 type transport system permease protein n=1 Tax=Cohnella lupini TaxID=1294267 RepID=A0A3D9ISU8_9BACL|nr:ABC transporter permease [Cohnella lupini]RED64755.1 ABC-2 type transport system permease protein [Cohnella lupini]